MPSLNYVIHSRFDELAVLISSVDSKMDVSVVAKLSSSVVNVIDSVSVVTSDVCVESIVSRGVAVVDLVLVNNAIVITATATATRMIAKVERKQQQGEHKHG